MAFIVEIPVLLIVFLLGAGLGMDLSGIILFISITALIFCIVFFVLGIMSINEDEEAAGCFLTILSLIGIVVNIILMINSFGNHFTLFDVLFK